MLEKARDLSGAGVWFLTVRVAEVGMLVLLVGALLDARSAWEVGGQYSGDGNLSTSGAEVSFLQRAVGMALFGGYRGPISLLVITVGMAGLLVVLHRCQPVSHTRVLRWEWLSLWVVATLLSLVASVVGVTALFGDDPYSSSDPNVITENIGPGYHEQVIGNLSWPLGALLLMLPLGLWWARLPDMDDLEDALAEGDAQQVGVERVGATVEGSDARTSEVGTRSGRFRRVAGPRLPGQGGGSDQDAIYVDDVEQIEPVERLRERGTDRGTDRGDGSSSSGYDGYFRRP